MAASISLERAARLGESANNRAFLLQALRGEAAGKEGNAGESETPSLRMDGRRPYDIRSLRMTFGRSHARSFAEVQLGESRVRTVVTASIVAPYEDTSRRVSHLQFGICCSGFPSRF